MMQTFQLRQDKKRLIEDTNRLHDQLNQCKEQNEQNSNEMCHLKIVKKDLEEQNCDLVEEIQMLRRIVSDLKGRLEDKTRILEESEWNLCQRNGELALIKSQLKDSQVNIKINGNDKMDINKKEISILI
jgi:chromosome segregation ATPase